MTRVLHVLEAAGFGTGRHLRTLVDVVEGHDHHVAVPPSRHRGGEAHLPTVLEPLRAEGVPVHPVGMRRLPPHPANALALRELSRVVHRVRPTLVHGHSAVGGALARLVAARHDLPCVYTPHGLRPDPVAITLERLLGRRTDRLVAVSDSEAAQVVRVGIVPADRVTTIYNALPPEPPPPARPGLRSLLALGDAPVVGYVGRLNPEKGFDLVVGALAHLRHAIPRAQAVLVAGGANTDGFDRLVARHGLEGRVHRLPAWPDAAGLLPELDVLVAPSRREAGPSFVVLEAMRVHVPVVVTDVVGLVDAVTDGVDGLRVPPDDPVALAAACRRLLQDPALGARLADAATIRLAGRHDPARFGAAHREVYASVLSASPGHGEHGAGPTPPG